MVKLKLDLGCGKNKQKDFIGVDVRPFEGVDQVVDLTLRASILDKPGKFLPWPWPDESVEAVHCSHFVEHLEPFERIHFVNELYRVLEPGGKALIVTPHWASTRAYGDLTHKWPPVSEFWFYYLNREWREANAPHNDGYTCDFKVTWGYSFGPELSVKNEEYRNYALQNFKDAAQDIVATFIKPEKK